MKHLNDAQNEIVRKVGHLWKWRLFGLSDLTYRKNLGVGAATHITQASLLGKPRCVAFSACRIFFIGVLVVHEGSSLWWHLLTLIKIVSVASSVTV